MKKKIDFTILMPCLNEGESISICIKKIKKVFLSTKFRYEILVADNGSTDLSREISKKLGAKVIIIKKKGYGYALREGISKAKGRNIIFADADNSYNFLELKKFLNSFNKNHDFVIGCRLPSYGGNIKKGAMPFLHRYIGNPFFSFLTKFFFKVRLNDVYCGFRGFSKEVYKRNVYYCGHMDFAIENAIKCFKSSKRPIEIPITLHKDSRITTESHLKTFTDGFKTLKLLLIFSPKFFFFIPGIFLTLASFFIPYSFQDEVLKILNIDAKYVIPSLFIFGLQLIFFGIYADLFSRYLEFRPKKNYYVYINEKFLYLFSLLLIFLSILLQTNEIFSYVEPYFFLYLGLLIIINTISLSFFKLVFNR